MTFLNHALLWGLPAVLLPIVIHLLNRLRYKSVDWAAVMFLVTATRSSTRHARLRQYLILLCRMMIILFLLLALARPLVGGWIGLTMSGGPDTIILLLDRSASMEAVDPRLQTSRREMALDLFSQASETITGSSRFVLIESVLKRPQEISGLGALNELAVTGPSDAAADIPAMLRAAVDYIVENQTGRTEIWLASDFQKTSWRPESLEWEALTVQMTSLPQDIRVRVLDLSGNRGRNLSISIANLQRNAADGTLGITVKVEKDASTTETVPIIVNLNGVRSQQDLTLKGNQHTDTIIFPVEANSTGWGELQLPADENAADNSCYFSYGKSQHLRVDVVSSSKDAARYLRLAAAPDPETLNVSASVISPGDWPAGPDDDLALVVWQADIPKNEAQLDSLLSFLQRGGTVVAFPPLAGLPNPANTVTQHLGFAWDTVEDATIKNPFRVITWEENEGPLAKAADGTMLPVDELAIKRRRSISRSEDEKSHWYSMANYFDKTPFLLRRNVGKGQLLVCTSLPDRDWSDLTDGTILVPMLQRLAAAGAQRLTKARVDTVGHWSPASHDQVWEPVDNETDKDFRWNAGVYRSGSELVALNVPYSEMDPVVVNKEKVAQLFGNTHVQILEKMEGKTADKLQSEIWHLLLIAAMICMLLEAILLLSDRTRKGVPGSPVDEALGGAQS